MSDDACWKVKMSLRRDVDEAIEDAIDDCLGSRRVTRNIEVLIIYNIETSIYPYFNVSPASEEEARKPMRKLDAKSKRHIRNIAQREVDKLAGSPPRQAPG